MGIPTVGITAESFSREFGIRARSLGHPNVPRLVVEHVLTGITEQEVRDMIAAKTEEVIKLIMTPVTMAQDGAATEERFIRYDGVDGLTAWDKLNEDFLRRKWGDGFPIVPPTPERVEKMLAGTKRRRDELVTLFEPNKGLATVEKIAINAVMAGCKPEHLPVVLTAVECMHTPPFNNIFVFCSTAPHAPFVMINGPIRKEIGINSGRACLGPGYQSWVNTVIGRAVRLCILNLGRCYAGEGDQDTIGSPNKYSMVIGENEEESPWEPYHVEQGFNKEESTVTVFGCESLHEVCGLKPTDPEGILSLFANTADAAGAAAFQHWVIDEMVWNHIAIVCPEHARNISLGGWGKGSIKNYIYHNARKPVKLLRTAMHKERFSAQWQWLYSMPDDYQVPVMLSPESLHVIVAGGAVGKSAYITGVSVPITKKLST